MAFVGDVQRILAPVVAQIERFAVSVVSHIVDVISLEFCRVAIGKEDIDTGVTLV